MPIHRALMFVRMTEFLFLIFMARRCQTTADAGVGKGPGSSGAFDVIEVYSYKILTNKYDSKVNFYLENNSRGK